MIINTAFYTYRDALRVYVGGSQFLAVSLSLLMMMIEELFEKERE
jgi:hypothetical protein